MRTSQRSGRWQKLPLIVWLVIVWGALWQDFSLGNLVFGALIAVGVSAAFYLPPVELSGRFNVVRAAAFALWFLKEVTVASIQVLFLAIFRGPRIRNAVIAVPLRTTSDLMMTAVGHILSLIPGSLVVEVDRGTSTLYVHALNVKNAADRDKVCAGIQDIEARLIRIMGSREELAELRAETTAPRGNPGKGHPSAGTPREGS
ncbi:MAG: Na+/H+ antiporter subunit E [Specibacter sp.]